MKGDNHPLVEAMKRPAHPMMPMRDMLSVDLPDGQVGDAVELSVLGVIKSIDDNGKASVEVQKVEEDQAETQQVQPQESHSP